MGSAARLRFAALRAGVEFFDHAAKSGIERRYVVGMRLFSDLISVMIHLDAAVGANEWIGFSHFNNFNEAERSSGRIAATPNSHRGDWKRFVVRADEKLIAFLELESAIREPG